jgi:RHS repeat-associated protein
MEGRTANSLNSRYGFNGKEKDTSSEFSAGQTHYDYGFRIYNPVWAKFLSVDPLTASYSELTPFQFASNTPIQAIDLDGLEATSPAIYRNNADGLPILIAPPVDNLLGANHPSLNYGTPTPYKLPPSRPIVVPDNGSISTDPNQKAFNQRVENGTKALKFIIADPEALKQGDPIEWMAVLPLGRFAKLWKPIKGLLKYSDEVADLVHETGKLDGASREAVTILKEGKRTFGNARKVVDDLIGDLGNDALQFVSDVGEGKNPLFGKVVGQISSDKKRYWRIDFDEVKGAHINWQNGKEKGAVLIEGGLDQVKRIVDNVLSTQSRS